MDPQGVGPYAAPRPPVRPRLPFWPSAGQGAGQCEEPTGLVHQGSTTIEVVRTNTDASLRATTCEWRRAMASQETPPTPAEPPTNEQTSSLPLVVLLVVAILAGGGVFYYQFHRQAAREQQSGITVPMGPISATTDSNGLIESYGEGDKIIVYAADPGSPCQQPVRDLLHALVDEHPSVVKVCVYQMGSLGAVERTGETCAGYAVYKKSGDEETLVRYFGKSPEAGGWTPEQLRTAVEELIAEAENTGEAEKAATETPDEGPAEAAA